MFTDGTLRVCRASNQMKKTYVFSANQSIYTLFLTKKLKSFIDTILYYKIKFLGCLIISTKYSVFDKFVGQVNVKCICDYNMCNTIIHHYTYILYSYMYNNPIRFNPFRIELFPLENVRPFFNLNSWDNFFLYFHFARFTQSHDFQSLLLFRP